MKKWVFTIIIASIILMLAACNTSEDESSTKKSDKPSQVKDEEVVDPDKDKSEDKVVDKEEDSTRASEDKNIDNQKDKTNNNQSSTSDSKSENSKPKDNKINYKKDSLFHYEMKSASNSYDVYIYSKDAKVQKTDLDWACEAAGENVYVGNFTIVTINKSDNSEEKLDLGKVSFNKDREPVEVVKGQPDLLISSDCLGSDSFESDTYTIDPNGKMVQLKDADGKDLDLNVTADLMKSTGKNTYQMAVFTNANEETNWLFYNLNLNENTHVMEIGESMIPKDLKTFDMRKWKSDSNYLVKE